ncbi:MULTISPECIES: hypothetical protein [unclassified Labrenzia]|uniref:hypothetical protein n=1 Tax=unclassified Labrenzia TaxID=2648686 RepID=UPI00126839EF|nr:MULTISPECIES: hypothetical protein [unclassified Labrenzia]
MELTAQKTLVDLVGRVQQLAGAARNARLFRDSYNDSHDRFSVKRLIALVEDLGIDAWKRMRFQR